MDIYQLEYLLHESQESEGWMYLAEIPASKAPWRGERHRRRRCTACWR